MNLVQAITAYGEKLKTIGEQDAYEWMCDEGFGVELRDHIKGCFENSDSILEADADLRFFINGEEVVNISEIRIECNFGDGDSMTTVVSREGIITDTFQGQETETRGQTFIDMFDTDFPEE